jgi:hypothetical protein
MWAEIKHFLRLDDDPPPLVHPETPPLPEINADIDQRKGDMRQVLAVQQAQHRFLQKQAQENRDQAIEARQTLAELRTTLTESMAPKPKPAGATIKRLVQEQIKRAEEK